MNPYINTYVVQPKHIPLERKLPGETKKTMMISRTYVPAHVDEEH